MISQAQLGYILNLVKYQNFQQAADACFVTQPTLSMQLKKAEETIGYKIINRDTNPISLTKQGEKLLPLLIELQNSYDELGIGVKKLEGTYKAEIKIGIIPTISNYLVPDIYAKWKSKINDVSLDIKELISEKLIKAVKDKTIDFGIMAGPLDDLTLNQQILYNEEILVYAPSIKKPTISIGELENETPWLLGEGNCLRTQMVNFCKLEETLKLEWKYEGGNLHLLVRMVKQEGGYTLIPQHYQTVLNVDPKDLKRIEYPTPIRQIIGFNLKRNTKTEDINKIIRIIQRNKNIQSFDLSRSEILPWKT